VRPSCCTGSRRRVSAGVAAWADPASSSSAGGVAGLEGGPLAVLPDAGEEHDDHAEYQRDVAGEDHVLAGVLRDGEDRRLPAAVLLVARLEEGVAPVLQRVVHPDLRVVDLSRVEVGDLDDALEAGRAHGPRVGLEDEVPERHREGQVVLALHVVVPVDLHDLVAGVSLPEKEASLDLEEVGHGRAGEDEEQRGMEDEEADALLPPGEEVGERHRHVDGEEPLQPQEPRRVVDEPAGGLDAHPRLDDGPGGEPDEQQDEQDDGELQRREETEELLHRDHPGQRVR